jgi:RNA polymerase sigma-70 factor, ECF subfamily
MTPQIDSSVVRQAATRAAIMVSGACFAEQDYEDLQQDLLVDYLRREPRFDAARGTKQGFTYGVMLHRAAVLVVRRQRRAGREVLFDHLCADLGGGAIESEMQISSNAAASLNLRLDIDRVLSRVPQRLKNLANQLRSMSISEVSVLTGRSRTRTYQLLRQLREAFAEAGLGPKAALRSMPARRRFPRSKTLTGSIRHKENLCPTQNSSTKIR